MSYLKDREIWLSSVPTGNPPAGYVWVFIQNGVFVVRDSNGIDKIMATTTGTVTNATSASYVEYSNVANKPTLISGSSQVSFNGITDKPALVSSSAQIGEYGVFATTGSNQFNGSQAITGSLTVTGQVVAQTLNVQQVTSSIVYSSGSNIFGNSLGNTQQFTGSVSVTGSVTVNGALSGTSGTLTGALSGTSATFSDRLNVTKADATSVIVANYDINNRMEMSANGFNLVGGNPFYIKQAGGSNQFTVTTTGNIGIGTTSPASQATGATTGILDVSAATGGNLVLHRTGSGDTALFSILKSTNGTYIDSTGAATAANNAIYFRTNNINADQTSLTTALTISSTGAATFASSVAINGSTSVDVLTISRNVADNAGGITLYNAETSGYGSALTFRVNYAGVYNVSRIHGDWGTGNSGLLHFFTANTSQTLVERMLINGSGNVIIGNTTAYGGLTVSDFTANDGNDSLAFFYRGTSGGHESLIKFYDFRGQVNAAIGNNLEDDGSGTQKARLVFKTSNSGAPTERMCITSGGYTKASTNGTYRSGATGEGHEFTDTSSSNINHFTIYNNSLSSLGAILRILGERATTNGTYQLIQASNGSDSGRFIVFDSGNVQNTNGSYGTIASDRRLKENIVSATPKLNDILKLNVVNFNLIGNKEKHIGFIAQEMQEVFPSFIHKTDTRKYDEEGNLISGLEDALGVKVGMEFAILVKAIQELKSENDNLKSRLEVLEQS
jgi:hypothetical protein